MELEACLFEDTLSALLTNRPQKFPRNFVDISMKLKINVPFEIKILVLVSHFDGSRLASATPA